MYVIHKQVGYKNEMVEWYHSEFRVMRDRKSGCKIRKLWQRWFIYCITYLYEIVKQKRCFKALASIESDTDSFDGDKTQKRS